MNVDFIRFKATDDVELQGWLSDIDGDTAVLHIHGMSGNGYENVMLDHLREGYVSNGISFMTINTRGAGTINEFKRGDDTVLGGSCYELLEESLHDIQGAIAHLNSIGKNKIILQGHSLGCTKAVNYVLNGHPKVEKVILLAPTDMMGWANAQGDHDELYKKAQSLVEADKPMELVDFSCWLNETPLSAQTYISLSTPNTIADVYNTESPLLGFVDTPMLIVYGTDDIGIKEIDGSMDRYLKRVNKIKNNNTQMAVIEGANHGFTGRESELSKTVKEFVL